MSLHAFLPSALALRLSPHVLSSPIFRFLPTPETLALRLGQLPPALLQRLATICLQHLLKSMLASADLDFLDHKILCIAVSGSDIRLNFSIHERQLSSIKLAPDNADVCIEADARALLHIAARLSDPDTLFFQRRLLITGDTELGLQLKNRLDAFEAPALLKNILLKAGEQWPLDPTPEKPYHPQPLL